MGFKLHLNTKELNKAAKDIMSTKGSKGMLKLGHSGHKIKMSSNYKIKILA